MKLVVSLLASLLVSVQVFAMDLSNFADRIVLQESVQMNGLNMNVGDRTEYKLNMGGFIQGTNIIHVREIVSEGIWLEQNMDMGFLGKQKAEILLDPNTGKTKRVIVNGQEQDPNQGGSQDDMEVIKAEESSVTVPAGTFEAIYMEIKNKKDNTITKVWLNPGEIPINGAAKMIAPSQMGEVVMELTSYARAN